jgi:hypothetical protein
MIASLNEHYEAIALLETKLEPPLGPTEVDADRSEALSTRIQKIAAERRTAWKPTFSERFERNPDGDINNCALVVGVAMEECQMCNGDCPDRKKYGE